MNNVITAEEARQLNKDLNNEHMLPLENEMWIGIRDAAKANVKYFEKYCPDYCTAKHLADKAHEQGFVCKVSYMALSYLLHITWDII